MNESRTVLLRAAAAASLLTLAATAHAALPRYGYLTEASTDAPRTIAQRFVQENREALGLNVQDLADVVVVDEVKTRHNGVTHLYLRQRLDGIEVVNGDINLNITRDGRVFNIGNGFVPGLATKVNATLPALSSADAIVRAADEFGGLLDGVELVQGLGGPAAVARFSGGALSLEEIPVKLMFLMQEDGTVRLVWEAVVRFHDGQRWYQTFVDAHSGAVLDHFNWIDDADDDTEGNCASECYDVIAFPKESPLDGGITTEGMPADPTASPFGWHDTNGAAGAEFTDTRGNNVEAQTDLNANNSFGGTDVRGEGGVNLIFNDVWDDSSDPADSLEASVNNLFYWNNVMHDILYQYGFDEASGNFQQNNYGNGGAAGDPVQADALDGSGVNNANFGSPPDGFDPRMQMFRWVYPFPNLITVNSGGAVGPYIMGVANFGPAFSGETGDIELADDATVPDVNDGCQPFTVTAGSIAFIRRGGCSFVTKVRNAQDGGAIAAIIQKITGGDATPLGDDGTGGDITIPSGMVSMADGDEILAGLPGVNVTITVNPNPPPDRDSDFDNGVIAHEYGHGVSNRLTGGPANVGCLNHNEQAGEGWSDWWTLSLMTDPADTATQARGVGNYLRFQGTDGAGIRNFPYSTDLAINPQTYANIGATNIPHGVGEIWAQMLWEVYWLLVDKHGYDPDLYNGTGGNNLAIQLVIDGMKMQPCSPTFVQARDAILAADMVNNSGANRCEIWTGFAKRGVGFSASAGGTGVGDETESFDFPGDLDPNCAATVLFSNGFEEGDTSAWDTTVP